MHPIHAWCALLTCYAMLWKRKRTISIWKNWKYNWAQTIHYPQQMVRCIWACRKIQCQVNTLSIHLIIMYPNRKMQNYLANIRIFKKTSISYYFMFFNSTTMVSASSVLLFCTAAVTGMYAFSYPLHGTAYDIDSASNYRIGLPLQPDDACNVSSEANMLSLIHIWRCRRSYACRSRWSPYH